MAEKLQYGDRVLVRRGSHEVEARVVEVYGPNDSHVLLAMPLHGCDGEVLVERTVSLPIRRVRRAAAV
jgi:hypothetical protein